MGSAWHLILARCTAIKSIINALFFKLGHVQPEEGIAY